MCFELAFERNLRIQTILGDPAAESAGDGGGGGGGESKPVHSTKNRVLCRIFPARFDVFLVPTIHPWVSGMCSD